MYLVERALPRGLTAYDSRLVYRPRAIREDFGLVVCGEKDVMFQKVKLPERRKLLRRIHLINACQLHAGNSSGVALGLSLTAGDYNGQVEISQLH